MKYLKRPIAQVHPIKKPDVRWARNNWEKANVFPEHIETRFHPDDAPEFFPNLSRND